MNWITRLFKRNRNAATEPEIAVIEEPTAIVEPLPEPVEAEPKPEVKPKRTRKPKAPVYEIELQEAFRRKYPEWVFVLDFFKAANLCEPTWNNLTRPRLQAFVDYMAERYAPNTVNQYAIRLKAVMNLYCDDIPMPKGYEKVLSPKKVKSTSVYLDESELKLLEQYQPKNDNELYVRNMFLVSAYTGARHIDACALTPANIVADKLIFIAQKTKKEAAIPLKPIVAEYINTTPRANMTDVSFNRIIRRICRNVGITDKVKIMKAGKEVEIDKCDAIGSHDARRSFASNLYLRGVDIYTISKMLQHSDIKLTEAYIVASVRNLKESELEYFA